MDEVVTASPGEDSPLHTEADTVYLPVTVSGGNAEVIAGSTGTGDSSAVNSPEGNSPYTVVFSADSPDYSEALQQIHEDLLQSNQYLSEQVDAMTEQLTVSQDQIIKIQENTLMISIFLGIIAGMLVMLGLWIGRK